VNIKFYAKTAAEEPASSFKVRIKKGSTGNNYSVSDEIFLSNNYELNEVEFDINEYFDSYKLQLLCGNETGYYYFDSFDVTITDNNMSTEEIINDVIQVYPNPTTGLVNLNFKNISNLNFEIFSINGKLIKNYIDYRHNQVDFNYLDNGVYFIRFYINNKVVVKKMIKK
jgi:hypothetical protein